VLTILTALLALWSITAWAAVPQLINFQGKVTDNAGNPVADGTHNFFFRIFDNIFSVTPLWSEGPLTLTTTGGLLNHWLGTGTPLPQSLFMDYPELYLEIEVDGEIQTPRVLLTSAPYAQVAGRVNSVDGAMGGSIDGSLSFGNASTPMLYVYESGTNNPSRSVVSHSPGFPTFGFFYNDATDDMYFQNVSVGIRTTTPNSRLQVNGAIATAVITAPSGPITLNESHSVVLCTPIFNTATVINLPSATGIAGRQYTIKLISVDGPAVIDPAGSEQIDGVASVTLSQYGKYLTIVSDGADWYVIANN
ncbi:MAG: hypothetical protein ACREBV_10745, partial [Candidatus Zixiibacteriota bacterium]